MKDKRITITGGKGFLGTHLIRLMRERGYEHMAIADMPEYDLTKMGDIKRLFDETSPDIVIHLAAKVGGIGFNQENPASLFYENIMMGVPLIHEAYLRRINKFVALGTICAYPKFTPVPFHEDDIWNGYPEETNAPYGLAKKMLLVQSQSYRQQYGFNSIFLLPVNLYGPGDNFTFASSHVVPALIRKCHLANLLAEGNFDAILRDFAFNKETEITISGRRIVIAKDSPRDDILTVLKHFGIYQSQPSAVSGQPLAPDRPSEAVAPPSSILHPPSLVGSSTVSQSAVSGQPSLTTPVVVEVWGTGQATREFFYAEDAAEAILLATERYNKSEPVNIGAGFEISIKDLTDLIVESTGFQGRVVWDHSKPDGQPRRILDTTRAYQEFGFKSKTSFREGLQKTIEWYVKSSYQPSEMKANCCL